MKEECFYSIFRVGGGGGGGGGSSSKILLVICWSTWHYIWKTAFSTILTVRCSYI